MAYIEPADVRAYLGTQADSGKFTDPVVTAAIDAAWRGLERMTHRQLLVQADVRTFSTEGRASLVIPDLQGGATVARDGVGLTENTDYWLLPARANPDIYTGIQFRSYSRGGNAGSWWLSYPDWWDRNLDRANYRNASAPPNDLTIDGTWGYDEPTDTPLGGEVFMPADALFAAKVLAAFYVLRPDSLLGNVSVTAEGAIRSYENLPLEVRAFVDDWRSGEQAVLI